MSECFHKWASRASARIVAGSHTGSIRSALKDLRRRSAGMAQRNGARLRLGGHAGSAVVLSGQRGSRTLRVVGEEDVAMRHIIQSQPVPTEETHRATAFEIFWDLVLVFALVRIIAFMAQPPTPLILAQGLVLLALLWRSFGAYAWLSNQVRADVGLIRAGMLVAMAGLFVAALVIPDAWRHDSRAVNARLILVAPGRRTVPGTSPIGAGNPTPLPLTPSTHPFYRLR